MIEQEYLITRIEDQIIWYDCKARVNKLLNNWSKGMIIFFSSIIPLFAGLDFCSNINSIILAIFGSIISILSGLSSLLKFQEKWTNYRTTSEILKFEKILYQTKTGPYNEEPEPFKLLVKRIENLLSTEHSAWSQYINNKN
jgi:hypothetical protein